MFTVCAISFRWADTAFLASVFDFGCLAIDSVATLAASEVVRARRKA